MPEGPTIHRLARDQSKILVGEMLRVESPQGRFADGAATLDKRKLDEIEAVGKHLFYHFHVPKEAAGILHVHLGLFGKYRVTKNEGTYEPPEPRGLVRVRLIAPEQTVDLNGPNTCEVLGQAEYRGIVDRLGADPLNPHADPAKAAARIAKSKAPIGQLLMDQSVIAGIGNIYRTELLWLIRVHPRLPGRELGAARFKTLWKLAVKLLNVGVKEKRIITVDPAGTKKPLRALKSSERFNIYKKPRCPRDGGEIERFQIATRNVFACPACQKMV